MVLSLVFVLQLIVLNNREEKAGPVVGECTLPQTELEASVVDHNSGEYYTPFVISILSSFSSQILNIAHTLLKPWQPQLHLLLAGPPSALQARELILQSTQTLTHLYVRGSAPPLRSSNVLLLSL